jgi:predicted nucleic acid-binding protein
MTLAFDTSILISIEKEDKEVINKINELRKTHQIPPQLPFIVYYEFLNGLKIGKPRKYKELLEFLNNFSVLQTTKNTADILSDLKIKYDKLEISLPLADLLIASQAIENHLTLVTEDKDFEKIEELKKIIL